MTDEIKKAKEFLTKEDISRIKVLIFLAGIITTIFMQTDIFDSIHVVAKILIIAGMFGVSILFKVDFYSSREIGKRMATIYKDKDKSWYDKGQEYGNMAMDLLWRAGEMWQVGKEEQFPETEGIIELKGSTVGSDWVDANDTVDYVVPKKEE